MKNAVSAGIPSAAANKVYKTGECSFFHYFEARRKMILRASGHYEIKVFLEDFACTDGPAPILLNFAAGSTFKVHENVGSVAEPEVAADAVFNPGAA